MKYRLFIFCILLLHVFHVSAQPVVSINSVPTRSLSMAKRARWLLDSTGSLSIQQIISKPFQQRVAPKSSSGKSVAWMKVKIKNNTPNPLKFYIVSSYGDTIDAFCQTAAGGLKRQTSGVAVSANDRPVFTVNAIAFPFKLDKGETGVYYFRFSGRHYFFGSNMYPAFCATSVFTGIRFSIGDWLFFCFYAGVFFLMGIYALALFIIFKKRTYLWLLLATVINILYFALYNGLLTRYIFPQHPLWIWYIYCHEPVSSLLMLAQFFFAASYLSINKAMPKFSRLIFIILFAGIGGTYLPAYAIRSFASYLLLLAEILFLGAIAWLAFVKKSRTAKIFFAAEVALLVAAIASILMVIFQINDALDNRHTLRILQYGFMGQGLLWTAAIIDRMVRLRKDRDSSQQRELELVHANEQIILKQNETLEAEVQVRTKEIIAEKRKSDDLLLNILPEEVSKELKERGATTAKQFDAVTVLFTDFVNFTIAGEKMTPKELVNELHQCFKAFDKIIDNYDIEKIKTVGDAYLAVAGLPTPNKDHAIHIVKAALEIRDFMLARRADLGDKTFQIRVGIHSGSVVAGIVGVKKFAYDIWGDTVNTAARMEQNSEAGKINISNATYALIKDYFTCTSRGKISAKNKGEMDMYFVDKVGGFDFAQPPEVKK